MGFPSSGYLSFLLPWEKTNCEPDRNYKKKDGLWNYIYISTFFLFFFGEEEKWRNIL